MADRLLGIDVGSTGVRAAIFAADGALLADASVPCPFDTPHARWAEIAPDAWWDAVRRVLAILAATSPNGSLDEVSAIGVVGQAPSVVLIDAEGAALGPAILWLDTRATREGSELGVPSYYAGPKLLWLANNGGSASRARWFLQSHAFLVHRLTGEAAIDPSTAALCLPLFDLASRAWRTRESAALGLRPEQLPPVRAAHEVVGHVTAAAASAIGHGLRPNIPVVAGGGDFAAATLGAGVVDEGEACLMLGTAGNLLVLRSTPGADPRLINAHHVGAERWLTLGGTLSGGAQEWLRHALAEATGQADASALPAYDVLDEEASKVAAGSEGLLFLPYLQGERTPIWDADARGAFIGLELGHGRGHLWRSLLEGIALSFVDCQEVIEGESAVIREVVAANGGGKSALFRQILCDALGVPLTYAPHARGTVAGAALLAGLGTGAVSAASDAKTWRGAVIRHMPNLEVHRRYRDLLRLRRDAYQALRPVFSGLANHR